MFQSRTEEFHEFANDALAPQHLCHCQHEIGRRRAFRHTAREAEADHVRDQHGDGLAQHGGFSLDAANAPSKDAKPVDHGRVRVGPVQRIRINEGRGAVGAGPGHLAQVFKVNLMANSGSRRHDAEIGERFLTPAQKAIPLTVAFELQIFVLARGVSRGEHVDLDGMVDDEINRHKRIDLRGVTTQADDAVTHGGEVDDGWHAGEVLHEDAGGLKWHFLRGGPFFQPADNGFRVFGREAPSVLKPQHVFEQHFQTDGKAGKIAQCFGRGGQGEILIGLAAHRQGVTRLQSVMPDGCHADDPVR